MGRVTCVTAHRASILGQTSEVRQKVEHPSYGGVRAVLLLFMAERGEVGEEAMFFFCSVQILWICCL